MFQHFNGRPSGQCRVCKTAAMAAHRRMIGTPTRKVSVVKDGLKLCLCCMEMKLVDEFSPSARGRGGVAAYCKTCFKDRFVRTDKQVRQATATYRQRHRERHLANHRVRMFEYRAQKKVTADGSVTDEFLVQLYATTNCFYCQKFTPREKRTADHKTSLHRHGAHTAGNLCMACQSCNSAKQDLSAEEFLEIIRV